MKVATVLLVAAAAVVQADIQPLIFGGKVVPAGQKTYTAASRATADGLNWCGGSLITQTHVLSAAHCAGVAKFMTIGSHFNSGNKDGEIIAVKQETRHPLYVDENSLTYDYAIIELASPSRFKPIKLSSADPETAFVGQTATVLGWGATKQNMSGSDELLRVNVPVFSRPQCLAANMTFTAITETMFCAGGKKNKDACNGDSGGPIILEHGKVAEEDILLGVVSWGDECGTKGKPGVYSKVSFVKSWILEHAPAATFV